MAKRVGMNCPHCNSRAQIRTSHPLTQTMREVYFLGANLMPVSEREEIARIHDILSNGKQRSIFDE